MSDPQTPFALVGGADRVRALVESFYDITAPHAARPRAPTVATRANASTAG